MAHDDEEETVEEHHGHSQLDLIRSYLAFGLRSIRHRQILASIVFVAAAALTVLLVTVWPRTYHCEMRLVTQHTEALNVRGERVEAFKGASDTIHRRENLETVVRQTELVKNWALTRPPALKLKDRVMEALRGPTSDADMESMLVATLDLKLLVSTSENTMTIGVDWPDAQMAGKLVEATHQTFLQVRHSADVSTIAEYISILEGHAGELRQEIDTLAEQVQKLTTGDRGKPGDRTPPPAASDTKTPAPTPRPMATRPRLMPDEDLPRLKTQLEMEQGLLKSLQEDRRRRLIELEARLTEAKARYTPAHPIVVDLEKQRADMSGDTPDITARKATIAELEAQVKERTANYEAGKRTEGTRAGGGPTPTPGNAANPTETPAGPLPTDVMQLVQNSADSVDPAIAAQFRYVVSKYTTVRDQISTARIDLDTAQAAFRHRYKVLTPAEIPNRPVKPKVPVMVAGGLIGGLFLALLIPIALELRRGRIVERWQVAQIHLPVLAELRFPPSSPD
jgi:uncharacterized protein involved in exopolysaccharide biosynthesis